MIASPGCRRSPCLGAKIRVRGSPAVFTRAGREIAPNSSAWQFRSAICLLSNLEALPATPISNCPKSERADSATPLIGPDPGFRHLSCSTTLLFGTKHASLHPSGSARRGQWLVMPSNRVGSTPASAGCAHLPGRHSCRDMGRRLTCPPCDSQVTLVQIAVTPSSKYREASSHLVHSIFAFQYLCSCSRYQRAFERHHY